MTGLWAAEVQYLPCGRVCGMKLLRFSARGSTAYVG